MDHLVPLAAANCPGTVPWNIVPSCKVCNSGKGRRHLMPTPTIQAYIDEMLARHGAKRVEKLPV